MYAEVFVLFILSFIATSMIVSYLHKNKNMVTKINDKMSFIAKDYQFLFYLLLGLLFVMIFAYITIALMINNAWLIATFMGVIISSLLSISYYTFKINGNKLW